MAQPYVGEIRMFAGNFAPLGWMFCNGQLISIPENDTLFNLIGTTYGGDGQNTFGLPDLRGRLPVHFGGGFVQGQSAGVETVTLTTSQIPSHNHAVLTTTSGQQLGPTNAYYANATEASGLTLRVYTATAPNVAMSSRIVSPDGGNQAHNNFQPYLCLSFIISLYGIYPTPG